MIISGIGKMTNTPNSQLEDQTNTQQRPMKQQTRNNHSRNDKLNGTTPIVEC